MTLKRKRERKVRIRGFIVVLFECGFGYEFIEHPERQRAISEE